MKDTLLLIISISFIIIVIRSLPFFKLNRSRRWSEKDKYSIRDWMEMTKEERKDIDLKEKEIVLERKRNLLRSIRKEYNKMKQNGKIN